MGADSKSCNRVVLQEGRFSQPRTLGSDVLKNDWAELYRAVERLNDAVAEIDQASQQLELMVQ